jgi:hypothetical protein
MTLKMASDELDQVLKPVWQSDSMHGCTAIWIFQVGLVRLVITRTSPLPILALGFPKCDITATEVQYHQHGRGHHFLQDQEARVGNVHEGWDRPPGAYACPHPHLTPPPMPACTDSFVCPCLHLCPPLLLTPAFPNLSIPARLLTPACQHPSMLRQ